MKPKLTGSMSHVFFGLRSLDVSQKLSVSNQQHSRIHQQSSPISFLYPQQKNILPPLNLQKPSMFVRVLVLLLLDIFRDGAQLTPRHGFFSIITRRLISMTFNRQWVDQGYSSYSILRFFRGLFSGSCWRFLWDKANQKTIEIQPTSYENLWFCSKKSKVV